VTVRSIRKLIATGDLRAVKVGSRFVRIRWSDLEELLRPVGVTICRRRVKTGPQSTRRQQIWWQATAPWDVRAVEINRLVVSVSHGVTLEQRGDVALLEEAWSCAQELVS
jgi:excisionase family DNA binding protein